MERQRELMPSDENRSDEPVDGIEEIGERPRPTALSVIAVVAAIAGTLILCFGVAVAVSAMAGILLGDVLYPGLNAVFGMLALIAVAAGAGCLRFAYGAWNLRPWAWKLGLVVALLLVPVLGPLGIVLGGLMAFYLLRTDIRQALGRA